MLLGVLTVQQLFGIVIHLNTHEHIVGTRLDVDGSITLENFPGLSLEFGKGFLVEGRESGEAHPVAEAPLLRYARREDTS